MSLVAVWHAHYTIMQAALAGYSLQISLRGLRIPISQVLLNSIIEKNSILRYDNDVFAERLKCQILYILSIDNNLAILGIVDPEQ
mgnify:CR=1 FL=1